MKVKTVSASVRYSKKLNDGEYKTIELGAEATPGTNETWENAQTRLYQELGQQLRTLWATKVNGKSNNGNDGSHDGTGHYCQQHGAPFQRYEKEGRVWYAHKAGEKWCKER